MAVRSKDGTKAPRPVYLSTDTGGTFTDFVLVADGKLSTFKLPSTPKSPDLAIKSGLDLVGRPVDIFAHGTTVATEIRGGVVTFLTLSYILFVQPAVLGVVLA